jgi:hypothetical protein
LLTEGRLCCSSGVPGTPGTPADAVALEAASARLRAANGKLRALVEERDAKIAALEAQVAELSGRVARLERQASRNCLFSELRGRRCSSGGFPATAEDCHHVPEVQFGRSITV